MRSSHLTAPRTGTCRPESVFLALLLVLLALPPLGQGAARRDSLSLARGKAALWRSAALNGWGQTYNGEWVKALVFSGTEIGILLSARQQHMAWQDWKDRRERESDLLTSGEGSATQLEFYQSREDLFLKDRNKLIWWWLWAKLICGLDAYVTASISNFDVGWDDRIRLEGVRLHEGSPGLRLRIMLD